MPMGEIRGIFSRNRVMLGRIRFIPGGLLFGLVLATVLLVQVNEARSQFVAVRRVARSPYAVQVAELREVNALLQKANHDYAGHRAKAMKHVRSAVHALHPRGSHRRRVVAKKGPAEAQAVSDAQLRAAIVKLQAVSAQLAT